MKSVLAFCIFFAMTLTGLSQLYLSDDFSDGDFSHNPPWMGDTSKFTVNGIGELQLNDQPVSGKALLYTLAPLKDSARWELYFRLEFNPSASNYLKIYLSSNQVPGSAAADEYYLYLGESGNTDALELHHRTPTGDQLVLRGEEGLLALEPNARIKVEAHDGIWTMEVDTGLNGQYIPQGMASGYPLEEGQYFGIECGHTSTRNDKFFFDNIQIGPLYQDKDAPKIAAVEVQNDSSIHILFNEDVNPQDAADPLHYDLTGPGNPAIVSVLARGAGTARWNLKINPKLINQSEYRLRVWDIRDIAGNEMDTQEVIFRYFRPEYHDLLINEFLPDPTPPIGLPEAEFVEIFNASPFKISLDSFTLSDEGHTAFFAGGHIDSGSYLILCRPEDTSLFKPFGKVYGLVNMPALNNSGDRLILKSRSGKVLDSLAYDLTWYGDENKKEGGWSLERINIDPLCEGKSNWHASLDPAGGTPGRINSVAGHPFDTLAPGLLSVKQLDAHTLRVILNEKIAHLPDSITLSGNLRMDSVRMEIKGERSFIILSLKDSIQKGVLYHFHLINVKDCAGNEATIEGAFLDAIPLERGDVVINEILFNPGSGGVDYLEIWNVSNKIVPSKGFQIIERDPSSGSIDEEAVWNLEGEFIMPASFITFTSKREVVLDQYHVNHPEWLIELKNMPNFPDDEGIVIIRDSLGQSIDSVHYFENWHYPLLADKNGVSLERIDPFEDSNEPANWFSASTFSGYGTPTDSNSQWHPQTAFLGSIQVEPEVFSPDLDGYNDWLNILIKTEKAGFTCRLEIYDSRGRRVKSLSDNQLLSAETRLRWEGLDDNDEKVREGIYILYFQLTNPDGNVITEKRHCVVAYRK